MSNEAKTEYLNSIREEYKKSNRRGKGEILRHAIWVTGLTRKRLIRRLNIVSTEPRRKPGRKPRYGSRELLAHLKRLWFLMEQPCSKKMKVLLPGLIKAYEKRAVLPENLRADLLALSPSTMDRLLKSVRVERGMCTTKAPSSQWYKSAVPVQPKDWNITEPGYCQGDTVSHCGEDASGGFASTLTVTDIESHWTALRATWTKKHTGIVRALRCIEKSLPFTLHTLKFDSGSEFMNAAVISYCRGYGASHGREKGIKVLRSRPYRKNDNCYVEQKNLTHVRQFIGYDRIECPKATELLNELYRDLWCPFLNFFMPTFKLIRKERVGSRIVKKHETPKTPYQRIMESASVSEEKKNELRAEYESLDPFTLKEQIEEKLKLLMEQIRKAPEQTETLKKTA